MEATVRWSLFLVRPAGRTGDASLGATGTVTGLHRDTYQW